ncbi:hypothetical protein MtrunA17_Chr7g0221221 [Medicago truncatula]|uniref:Transmembrane protein, putative n=1 Tax=Medicago truncatula TaxID=3880 RepID=A0A072TWM6_MEDTR|nr:transmembrane protein, putative [Medicago truncatula]RHN44605.1 hypothetical protein MtrunA17_Chr7g0221221 [Medicago truncatula]
MMQTQCHLNFKSSIFVFDPKAFTWSSFVATPESNTRNNEIEKKNWNHNQLRIKGKTRSFKKRFWMNSLLFVMIRIIAIFQSFVVWQRIRFWLKLVSIVRFKESQSVLGNAIHGPNFPLESRFGKSHFG